MNPLSKIFLAVMLAVSVGVALLQLPALSKAQNAAYDQTTESDLNVIRTEIQSYITEHDKLPTSLGDAVSSDKIKHAVSSYEFKKLAASKYELCATFKTEGNSSSPVPASSSSSYLTAYVDFSEHPEGHHCFTVNAYSSNLYDQYDVTPMENGSSSNSLFN